MTQGIAKAALRLAELPAEDRTWLLAQLREEDRAQLSTLIERVTARGEAAVPAQPENPATSSDALQVIARANGAQMALVLEGEPEWLVALLLARRAWPWARDYLDRMEPAALDRMRLLTRRVDAAATPATFDSLIDALVRKLDAIAPELTERTAFDSVVSRFMGWSRPASGKGGRGWRA